MDEKMNDLSEIKDKIKKDYQDFLKYLNEVADSFLNNKIDDEIGSSKKSLISENEIMELFSYEGYKEYSVLIVTPLINGYYILDLLPEISFTNFLIQNRISPYIIKWKNLKEYDEKYNIEYYVIEGVKKAIDIVSELDKRDVVLIGHCLGGVLTSLYLSYFENKNVSKYISMNSPYDFSKMGIVSFLTSKEIIDIDKLVDTIGNIPAEYQTLSFQFINPAIRFKNLMAIFNNYKHSFFMRVYKALLYWRDDNIDMPGEFGRELIKYFFQENRFFDDKLEFINKKISLSNIKIPVLNIISQFDDIAPYPACDALSSRVSNVEKLILPDGHLAIVLMSIIGIDHRNYWEEILKWIKK